MTEKRNEYVARQVCCADPLWLILIASKDGLFPPRTRVYRLLAHAVSRADHHRFYRRFYIYNAFNSRTASSRQIRRLRKLFFTQRAHPCHPGLSSYAKSLRCEQGQPPYAQGLVGWRVRVHSDGQPCHEETQKLYCRHSRD